LYGIHAGKRTFMEALQWSDVSLDFRVVTFKRSKSGKGYQVPINATALAAFNKLAERCADPDNPQGPVIRKPSGIELLSCRKWFETCLAKAGIEGFCWHDLRHTAATRLRAAGVPIEDIRYLLGHGARSITERYAHLNMALLRQAVAKLDRSNGETDTKTDTATVLQFRTA
jgi:integrase